MANSQLPNAQNISRAIHNIADGFRDLANEATRMQNMPASDQGAQIIQMLQQLLNGQQQLRVQVGELQNHQRRIPMMLYNASANDLAQLRYPIGIPIDNLPENRRALTTSTGPQLQVAAGVLGLPALPGNAPVGQRRAQIAEYLGIPW